MSKHPYPKHVITGVAKALMKSSEGRDAFGAGGDWEAAGHTIKQEFLGHAETALQTLWDASRVDTVEQSEQMSDDMRLKTFRDAYMAPWSVDAEDLPAHVIDWGDRG